MFNSFQMIKKGMRIVNQFVLHICFCPMKQFMKIIPVVKKKKVVLDLLNGAKFAHDFTSLELTYSEFFKRQDGILV